MKNEKPTMEKNLDRRSFFKRSSLFGLALLPAAGLLSTAKSAGAALINDTSLSDGDVAVLQFLRAAEFVEEDLWGQYAELAVNNADFRSALKNIDSSLPEYVIGDHEDELSHALFITAFLQNAGVTPVDLSSFYTLPASPAKGVDQSKKHLTSLTSLSIDTSWYLRYRMTGNPDFGDTFDQVVDIANRPTIPTATKTGGRDLDLIAQTAAFHFGAIEQGGSSLYVSLLPKVTNADVVSILGSIGPTEFYHFALFQTALEGIKPLSDKKTGLEFPALKKEIKKKASNINKILTPNPCKFIDESLPVCSVVRPITTPKAGALAAAGGLAASGLFAGQPQGFVDAVVALAMAADAAERGA